jgi:hypothetical protein
MGIVRFENLDPAQSTMKNGGVSTVDKLTQDEKDLILEALEQLRSSTEDFGIKMADSDEEAEENKQLVIKIEAVIAKVSNAPLT